MWEPARGTRLGTQPASQGCLLTSSSTSGFFRTAAESRAWLAIQRTSQVGSTCCQLSTCSTGGGEEGGAAVTGLCLAEVLCSAGQVGRTTKARRVAGLRMCRQH